MPRYIITYDLTASRTTTARYQRLYERIRSYPDHVWIAQSAWVISTADTAGEVRDYLKAVLRRDDKLLVGILGLSAWSGLNKLTTGLLRAFR